MPWGDRTGPLGLGPGTGRRMGYCSGHGQPGYMSAPRTGWSRGFRRGMGFHHAGFGWGYRYFPFRAGYPDYPLEFAPEEEKQYLEEEASWLEKRLKSIQKRLAELTSKEKD